MSQGQPSFSNWILGIVASVIVVSGGALLATMVQLREDVAVIKLSLQRVGDIDRSVDMIGTQVIDHEHRLRFIERDNTSLNDTLRRRYAR